MVKAYLWLVAVVLIVVPCMSMDFAGADDVKAANDAAQQWLALVDSGNYGESWDQASAFFKEKLSKEQWEQALNQVRTPLGKMQSREFKAAEYKTELPKAPPGRYMIIQYRTKFANGGPMIETITPMMDNGTWRVSGYYIKPVSK